MMTIFRAICSGEVTEEITALNEYMNRLGENMELLRLDVNSIEGRTREYGDSIREIRDMLDYRT